MCECVCVCVCGGGCVGVGSVLLRGSAPPQVPEVVLSRIGQTVADSALKLAHSLLVPAPAETAPAAAAPCRRVEEWWAEPLSDGPQPRADHQTAATLRSCPGVRPSRRRESCHSAAPPLFPLVGVSIGTERGRQRNDGTLADGYRSSRCSCRMRRRSSTVNHGPRLPYASSALLWMRRRIDPCRVQAAEQRRLLRRPRRPRRRPTFSRG